MRIILLLLLLLPFSSLAQQDSVKKTTEVYCMLVVSERAFSNSPKITLDYGYLKDKRIKDQSAEVFAFNSIIDALNYMSRQGWQLVSAYSMTLSGSNVYHYMLKRELPST